MTFRNRIVTGDVLDGSVEMARRRLARAAPLLAGGQM